jgi:hypothetical protein
VKTFFSAFKEENTLSSIPKIEKKYLLQCSECSETRNKVPCEAKQGNSIA